ncbi:caspase family protein [Nostoc sp. C117]|uniref:nSTAND1 domain-containing NTPase n=1 Tax=Nostoc sp. C117 TaxID=3349875 RepID=UPI00370D618F
MSEFSRNIACIIGINNYTNGICPLHNAVNDAKELVEILQQKHEYKVWVCLNEEASLKNFNELLEKILPEQVSENDRLLFYFAGHGIAQNGDDGPEGYLIPQDAKLGDVQTYLPMTKLQESLSKLPCRHFLGILDCCFAGAFRWSSNRDLLTAPEVIHKERYDRFISDPAWQVITSAASDQKALDAFALNSERGSYGSHSPFAAALIEALVGKADIYPPATNGKPSGDGVITATELYLYIRDTVEPATQGNRQRQTPGIWPLKKHDKGEYIFLSPGHPLNLPPAPPLDASKNPYRGLESYNEEHSQLFFGRTELVEKLHNFVKTHPLTVVLGASGSGKSSLVKAGLIPQLRQDNTEQWYILPLMRPGETPMLALNNALKNAQLPEVVAQNLQQSLAMSIHALGKNHPNSKLLLFIDQSEEIITLCQNEDERKEFFQQILKAINVHRDRLRVVLSLRSDFEPQLRDAGLKFVDRTVNNLENTELKNRWYSGRFIIPAMTRGELRQAIEKPAETQVMYFQPHELVEQLINEVANMPGALPLLSFALSELYLKYLKRQRDAQNRSITIDRALTQEDYQDLGGVIQSLTQRADEEYETLVKENPAYAQIIRHVMLRMIALGGGELARRRVPLSELEYPPEKNSLVKEVIERFTKARLLVKGEDTDGNPYVEPAHDALVRGWQKLLMWKQEEQESLVLQQRLTPAATEWNSIKNKDKEQPKGILDKADPILDWLNQRLLFPIENKLSKIPAQFSRLRRQPQNQQGQSREKPVQFLWNANPYLEVLDKELNSDDNWFNQVETEFVQQSVWKRRWNLYLVRGSVILFTAAVSVVAYVQWKQNQEAQSMNLAASSRVRSPFEQQLDALVQAIKSGKTLRGVPGANKEATYKVVAALLQTLSNLKERNRFFQRQPFRHLLGFSFSLDGSTLISKTEGEEIQYFSLQGKEISAPNDINNSRLGDCEPTIIESSTSKNGFTRNILSPDQKLQVSWDDEGFITLSQRDNYRKWTVQAYAGGHSDGISCVCFSPDGQMFASVSTDGTIKLWSVEGIQMKKFKAYNSSVNSVRFSPDGKTLASAGNDKMIKIWSLEGKKLKTLQEDTSDSNSVSILSFSPDGKTLASANDSGNRSITLWSLEGKEPKILNVENGTNDISFSSDGKMLASASNDGSIKFWRLDGSSARPPIPVLKNLVNSVSFSRDGKMLVSSGKDGWIKLWNLNKSVSQPEKAFQAYTGPGLSETARFSPDGKSLVVDHDPDGNKIKFFRISDHAKLRSFEGNIASFNPDGKMLAIGSDENGDIKLWSADGEELATIQGQNNFAVKSLDFSPDGKTLASASEDGTIVLWNLDLDQLLAQSCDWARDYLENNPKVSDSDRHLCDDVPPTAANPNN